MNLRSLAIGIVAIVAVTAISRLRRRVWDVARGRGRWQGVNPSRRIALPVGLGFLAALILFLPLPRFRSAEGWCDAANPTSVFTTGEGTIEEVFVDYGDRVKSGDPLVRLSRESLAIEHAKLTGQLRVARLRSSLSRRTALDRSESADQWKTLQAAEDAVVAQLASVSKRSQESEVRSPARGVVLPIRPTLQRSDSSQLESRVGMSAEAHRCWCRISRDGQLHAVLVVDARDRTHIDVGTNVRISLQHAPGSVFLTNIASVSAIREDTADVTRRAAYHVLCPLPSVDEDDMLRWLGIECRGVFHLPNRSLASDLTNTISEWLGGE